MKRRRVSEIDLLRCCAVIAVILFHYAFRGYAADHFSSMPYPWLAPFAKYGYLGVELFFMVSGFVILMTASSGDFRQFIVSRVVRLYPAFWAGCTLTFLSTLLFGSPRFDANWWQYLVNLTMLAEFLRVPSIDGVYWSLYVELKFYFFVGVVLLMRSIHRTQVLLTVWLVLTVLLTLMPNLILRYVFIADYATFFVAGATCFLIWSEGLTKGRALLLLASWLVAIDQAKRISETFQVGYGAALDGTVAAGVVTSFYIVMILVALGKTVKLRHWAWPVAGAVTYPLYLIHQFMGYMVFNRLYPAWNAHVLLWTTFSGMIVLAYLIHRLVERPLAPLLKRWLLR